MSEITARRIAEIFGGEAYDSGGGFWVVKLCRKNGRLVLISGMLVSEYASEEAYEHARNPIKTIEICD